MNVEKIKSKNYNKASKKQNLLIVVHWAACTGAQCVYWFLSPACRTSAHYVIDRYGKITQMVKEKNIAWHAGYSSLKDYPTSYRGREWESLNICSIGIELAGPPSVINRIAEKKGWTMHWEGWPEKEINGLIDLCKDILTRYPDIRLTDHSTIAPGRKGDVKKGKGIDLFPWDRLLQETGIKEA